MLLSEKTTAHNPGTMYGRRSCSVGGRLPPGVSHCSEQAFARTLAYSTHTQTQGESSLIIDLAIEFFSVLITLLHFNCI